MPDIKKIKIGTNEYNLRDDSKASNTAMTGATSSAKGVMGLVPEPKAGDQNKVLTGNGQWTALGTAASKNTDASIAASSTSTNLPTSAAVASFVEGKGYKTTDTDTKNTAGSTNTNNKIFLVGATSQAANPQTYSHDTAYVGTDGCLYSGGEKVLTAHQDISGKADKSEIPTKLSQLTNDSGYTTNVGTITGIKMNGASKGSTGVVDLGTVITAHQDISGKMNASLKGAANGVAELDSNGKVPSSQLPSFVDDVLEYTSLSKFPASGEAGKIYVATDTNKTYRWSGTAYVEISESLALGETSSTAYRGDRGKTAYDHASAKGSAFSSGLYKITTNSEGHVTAATAVSKTDITALGIPGSDTNTHRPIQVNGTEVLGNNTTALNLKAGSNVTVTNSSGTVTIAATNSNTTYTLTQDSSDGHKITLTPSSGSATTITIPDNNTDTKVTSAANHYTPSTASGSDVSASASGATAAWSIDVVKGVTLNTDGKGHVTGLSVTSGKIPANPNSDTKVTQTATTTNATYEVLFSASADNTTKTEGARKTSTLTYNPSTKALSTGGAINGYSLNAACAKAVDTSISSTTSANLPTSAAVAAYVDNAYDRYVQGTTLYI